MAVYRINWAGIQANSNNLTCTFSVFANFGDAVLEGAEVETNGQLTARVSAGVSASNITTELQTGLSVIGLIAGRSRLICATLAVCSIWADDLSIFEGNDGFARLDYHIPGPHLRIIPD